MKEKPVLENKITDWFVLRKDLKKLKKDEMKLRVEICRELNTENAPAPVKLEYRSDWITMVAEYKLSYSLDEAVFDSILEDLSKEEIDAVKHTPNLKLKEYKKLPEDSLLHEAVTSKPAAPTLKETN